MNIQVKFCKVTVVPIHNAEMRTGFSRDVRGAILKQQKFAFNGISLKALAFVRWQTTYAI
jgi:hypothetical protein